jgi:hypothetical protein
MKFNSLDLSPVELLKETLRIFNRNFHRHTSIYQILAYISNF